MANQDCWQLLGIAPTPEERDIKRAYAKLVKSTRPEDDPDAFQRLRDAFEQALWAADDLRRTPPVAPAEEPATDLDGRAAEIEAKLKPWIEHLADLNERGSKEDALAALEGYLADPFLAGAAERDPQVWELFEDGMMWVCCDITANHDDFLRRAITMFDWLNPEGWLAQRDPKTFEWLKLRLQEAEALDAVDVLLDLLEREGEQQSMLWLDALLEGELLVNVDVRHLFEAELMVGLSEFQPLPLCFASQAIELFGWRRDHRHLEEYHPEAWADFRKKSGVLALLQRAGL
ncbi:hypothetical protein [Chitinimonas lacunae]|uniref:J domain-containing protein n=1 Tax=Chitinimonas lacunae TaxID=1963018 RepID=A0ABV8MVC4_9NEIS